MLHMTAIGIGRLDCKVRCDTSAAVNYGRSRSRQLNGRNLKRLSKRDCCQFYRPDILHLVHDGTRFSRQINARFIQKSELSEIRIVPFHTDTQSYRDKYGVAGIHRPLHKIFRPVASHLVTAYPAVFHHDESRTVESICGFYHAGLQARCRRYNLKGRSRLIGIIDAAVSPHGI